MSSMYHAWKLDGWDDIMREALAKNIARYRKELGLTQDALASKLGVSYHAI